MSIRESQPDLDPTLLALDQQLRQMMTVTPPAGLADRIHAATSMQLAASVAAHTQLETDLRQALHVATPADMAARIHLATANQLQPARSEPVVIGRIGWAWRSAVAAAVAIAAGSALWFAAQQPPVGPNSAPGMATLPVNPEMTALRTELHRFEQVLAPYGDPLNTQLLALRVELDGMSLAMETERLNGPGDHTLDLIQAELHLLEAEVQAF